MQNATSGFALSNFFENHEDEIPAFKRFIRNRGQKFAADVGMGIAGVFGKEKQIMKKQSIIAVLAVGAAGICAADTPLQLSLTPDIALYPNTEMVRGLSLNVWGQNPQSGLTIGFVNGSTGDSGGFSWGLVNYAEDYTGVQWGALNISTDGFAGWQHGWVNISRGTFSGWQSGWICNFAEDFHGLQLGLLNYAENLQGVQLGFANIAGNNPWFVEFPDKLATDFPSSTGRSNGPLNRS